MTARSRVWVKEQVKEPACPCMLDGSSSAGSAEVLQCEQSGTAQAESGRLRRKARNVAQEGRLCLLIGHSYAGVKDDRCKGQLRARADASSI